MPVYSSFLPVVFGLFVLACNSPPDASAAPRDDIRVIKGACDNTSFTVEGPLNEKDLTKYKKPFHCNIAVFNKLNGDDRHVMVQFSNTQSHINPMVGFAGIMNSDYSEMLVQHVYLAEGQPINTTSESECRFFYTHGAFSGIACKGVVDNATTRTGIVVVYNPS